MNKSQKSWTDKEVRYLENSWGVKNIDVICAYLHRSKASVHCKAHDMGIYGQKHNTDGIPVSMLPEITGVAYENIRKTWVRNGLKIYTLHKNMNYVKEEDLYAFMKSRPDLWVATKCDRRYFRQFDWFTDILNMELNGQVQHKRRKYNKTDKIVRDIRRMRVQKGMYYKDIAKELNTTPKVVRDIYMKYIKEDI